MVHLSPAKPKPLPLPLLILLIFYYDPDSQLGPTYSCGPQEHSVTCKIHSGVTLGCVHAPFLFRVLAQHPVPGIKPPLKTFRQPKAGLLVC